MISVATVTSKGQITIPIEIRRQMGLLEGEKLEFQTEAGVTTLRRLVSDSNPFAKWAGRLGGMTTTQDAIDWQNDLRNEE